MSYPNVLFVAQLESLETRRNNLSRSFFQDICKPTSCLHHLIPPPRDTSVTTRLRLTTSLPRPNLRTKKYCSLINCGLHHYQPTQWLLTHSTHLSQHLCTYIHIVCFVCCFYFVSEMTYTVSSGTLNSSISYHTIPSIISTAYHLLSGSRTARLILNWLIHWFVVW